VPPLNDDEQFETYLKQFHPLAPEPLPGEKPERAPRRKFVFAAWGVAAAAAIIAAVLMMRPRPEPPRSPDSPANMANVNQFSNSQPLTLGDANALLAHAPSAKAAIDQLAFPSPTTQLTKGTQSALAVLSKENIKL